MDSATTAIALQANPDPHDARVPESDGLMQRFFPGQAVWTMQWLGAAP